MVMHQCNKSEDITQIKKILFGNGKKGLIALTSDSYAKIDSLHKSIADINANVKVLVQFQTQVETKEQQNAIFDNKLERIKQNNVINKRWRIGLSISTILGLLAIVVSLLAMTFKEPPQPIEKGVTEDEFQTLWEDYKDKHDIRGFTVGKDTIN